MEFTPLPVYVYSAILLLLCDLSCSQTEISSFYLDPIVDEGQILYMICFGETSVSNPTLVFSKDGRHLTSNNVILDEDIKNRPGNVDVRHFQTMITAELYFRVTREDTGLYQCCIYDSKIAISPLSCHIRPLQVTYLSDPICTPLDSIRVIQGENATLSCSQEEEFSTGILTWTRQENATIKDERFPDYGAIGTASVTLSTDNGDINDIFTCTASNGLSERNCSVEVRTIWPSLSINPSEVIVDINEAVVKVTCNSIYYEPRWEWETTPSLNSYRISTATNEFTIRDITIEDNDTTISCYAFYNNRWFQASAKLYVRKQAPQTNDQLSGWKVAFSLVFIIMIAAFCVIAFLLWKKIRKLPAGTSSNPSSNTAGNTARTNSAFAGSSPTGDPYSELQKPTSTEEKDTYTELRKPKEKTERMNDVVYEITDAEANTDYEYEYAE